MAFSWWQRVLDNLRVSKAARCKQRRSLLGGIEPLEDRRLMATRVWDGDVARNDQWTERRNWVGNIRPVFGDDLVFPDSIRFTDRGLNNDFPAGTQFNNITFEGEGYLIRGNSILLSGDIIYAPRSVITLSHSHFNLDIRFSDGNHRIKLVSGVVPIPELEFHSKLSDDGDGDIIITGGGTVIFGGNDANTINGHDIVVENTSGDDEIKLLLDKPDNVAAIAGPLVVGNGGAVVVADRGLNTTFRKLGQLKSSVDVTLRNGGFLAVAHETIDELTVETNSERASAMFILNRELHDDFDDNVGGVITLTDTVTVTGNGTAFVGSDAGRGRLRLNPGSTTPREFNVATGANLKITQGLAEGDLRKTGGGILFLRPGENNTHGTTFIDEGALTLASGFSPDTPVDGRIFIPHDLFIRNGARVFHRTHSNAIADSAAVHLSDGAQLLMSDGVEETIDELIAEGGSNVEVSDADTELVVNDFAELKGGSQLTAENGASAAFLDLIVLDRSTATANEASLRFEDVAMSGGFLRSIGADGSTLLTGKLTTNGVNAPATINGKLRLTPGNHEFVVVDGDAVNDLVINALIDDGSGGFGGEPASITKNGGGRMLLTRANTYRGTTTLTLGTLVVNDNQSLAQGAFIVNGGILTGQGRVREISQRAGVLAPGSGVGIFTATEAAFLGNQSRLVVQINGPTVGTQFDQFKTGELVLDSQVNPLRPKLDVRLGFTPNVGQQFRIVDVTGNTQLSADEFFRDLQGNDLPEGASFQVDGLDFTITYQGGNGNDVVITRNTAPAFENITITPEITEGQRVVVTGHITEPNARDAFFLDVDWGDGSLPQTFHFAPGSPRNIQVGHRYLDDPAGTNDRYHVRLSWRDQFGGNNGAQLTTVVRNAAPLIHDITASLPPLRAGEPITIQGVISDRSPSDTFKVFIQWSANGAWQSASLAAGSTTFTFRHTYNRPGQHQVTVLLIDDDLDFDQESFVLSVE